MSAMRKRRRPCTHRHRCSGTRHDRRGDTGPAGAFPRGDGLVPQRCDDRDNHGRGRHTVGLHGHRVLLRLRRSPTGAGLPGQDRAVPPGVRTGQVLGDPRDPPRPHRTGHPVRHQGRGQVRRRRVRHQPQWPAGAARRAGAAGMFRVRPLRRGRPHHPRRAGTRRGARRGTTRAVLPARLPFRLARTESRAMKRTKLYLGGEWVQPTGSDVLEVENPATEQIIGVVPAAGAADVDRAVHAARDAFPAWSGMSPRQRADYLDRLWQGLHRRRDDIARTITMELGTPLKVATAIQAGLPLTVLRGYADLAEGYEFTERIGHSLILKEPIGVVAAITPWNYPLHQMIAKVAPALLAGCTVVLKPAELTPFVAYLLA